MSVDSPDSMLAEVFVIHSAKLRIIARKIAVSPDVIDDVMQDAYLKLIDSPVVRKVTQPFGYCCQVVRNVAIDYCRRQSLEASYRVYMADGELPEVPNGFRPEAGLDERKLIAAVAEVLDTLPERTRLVFELYRLHGMTQRDIGERIGCSATLVNFLLRDAMNALMCCRDAADES